MKFQERNFVLFGHSIDEYDSFYATFPRTNGSDIYVYYTFISCLKNYQHSTFFNFVAMIFIINYFYNGRIILKFEFFENALMQLNSMDVEWNAVDIR
jgi:hypothetical protein